ncbi:MAG: hypothetical protein ACREUC_13255, partial [Steroidobacteraceae bacterium]
RHRVESTRRSHGKRATNRAMIMCAAALLPNTPLAAVFRDQVPCQLVNVSGSHKGGVLITVAKDRPMISFLKHRDAERAIERTERVRKTLQTSLVSDWLKHQVPSLLDGAKFEIVPIGRQKAA